MGRDALTAHMSVQYTYAWCPQRAEDGTGVTDTCESLVSAVNRTWVF